MPKHAPHLDLFGFPAVKPESRAEKRAKQNQFGLRSEGMPGVTMERLWEELEQSSSYDAKTLIHWNTSGPFGGDTKHVACGVVRTDDNARVLVEHVTCLKCRARFAKAWTAMAGYSRGIEEESYE